MSRFEQVQRELYAQPRTWLVTGVAGFIGSHLLEGLLSMGQTVIGVDNFVSGSKENLEDVRRIVGPEAWARFTLRPVDIRSKSELEAAFALRQIDIVLHHAALASVPGSIEEPALYDDVNVRGFVNVLEAARANRVSRFVYASSSAVYGDNLTSPKRECDLGNCLSPYAATKRINEIYADVYNRNYPIRCVGLRYFNVFGPRQNPDGAYAAVIPRWVNHRLNGERCTIYGDGSTSRDFCYVTNVVQANILAAVEDEPGEAVFNVGAGRETSLLTLYKLIGDSLGLRFSKIGAEVEPVMQPFRAGDVKHSVADINAISEKLHFAPAPQLEEGIHELMKWHAQREYVFKYQS